MVKVTNMNNGSVIILSEEEFNKSKTVLSEDSIYERIADLNKEVCNSFIMPEKQSSKTYMGRKMLNTLISNIQRRNYNEDNRTTTV